MAKAVSAQAIAYHSITIGDKNTWDDWHLVPTSRPKFNMPSIKSNYVDIPGSDGVLDLTTALTGRPTYGNRQGSFEFLVMNDYGNWYDRYSTIANYLHGRTFQAVLNDDPMFYYEGRFSVNEWKSEKDWSRIVIDYNVGPYKLTTLAAGELWLWDPFWLGDPNNPNDKGDLITTYKNKVVNGTLNLPYKANEYDRNFTINVLPLNSSTPLNLTLTFKDVTYTLKRGIQTLTTLILDDGINTLVFNGKGKFTIETGGML